MNSGLQTPSSPSAVLDTPAAPATRAAPAGRAPPSRHPLQPVFEAGTVRARCAQVLQSVERGLSAHFVLKRDALVVLADQVADQMAPQETGSGGGEPSASAWLAFPWPQLQAAGVDRLAELHTLLVGKSAAEHLRAQLDLAVVTVLLGTDIGPLWRCSETRALPTAAFVHAPADDLLALLDSAAPPRAAAASVTAPASAPPAADAAGAGADSLPGTDVAVAPTDADTSPAAPAPVAPPAPPEITAAPPPPAAAVQNAQADTPLAGAEGLAVAVFRAFVAGAFSAHQNDPCRVDAAALRHIDVSSLRAILQGTPTNPVPALEERARLLAHLGTVLQDGARSPASGGAAASSARACSLLEGLPGLPPLDALPGSADSPAGGTTGGTAYSAEALFTALLRRLAPAWRAGSTVQGLPAGDVWPHLWAGDACGVGDMSASNPAGTTATAPTHDRGTGGWVPLHAQGLKLVAALEGPLHQAGCAPVAVQALPVSACRATSALMLRAQVLVPRHSSLLQRSLKPGHDAVVENRSLTVALFEELALLVQQRRAQRGLPTLAAPSAARLVPAAAHVLRKAPALQLKIEGDGALF